ncbi:MAG TPA: hypothetical protein VGN20_10150 [Mucilaginibacter sp.]|jgi:hypothetical protein
MKISYSLLISFFFLAACKKEEASSPKTLQVTSTTAVSAAPSLMPDGASFKIKLVKDATHSDEVDFIFKQSFSSAYVFDEDALYLGGGQASLSSISSDGRNLSINGLPYTKGMSIGLNVNTAAPEGTFYLQNSYTKNMPANIHVWLNDVYLKDSVEILKVNYNFTMTQTDANSSGSNRFKLIIRQ